MQGEVLPGARHTCHPHPPSSSPPNTSAMGRVGADGPACASRSRSTRSFLARKKSSSTCHSLRWMPLRLHTAAPSSLECQLRG